MLDVRIIPILIFFPSVLSLFHLWTAYYSLYSIKKSKTARKKIGREIKFWKKLLLLYPIKQSSLYYKKMLILRRLYYLAIIASLLSIFVFIITLIFSIDTQFLFCCVVFKVIILDLPIGVFAFVMTKHGKNGGVVWKWEN